MGEEALASSLKEALIARNVDDFCRLIRENPSVVNTKLKVKLSAYQYASHFQGRLLHIATKLGNAPMVRCLLEHGANGFSLNDRKRSALDYWIDRDFDDDVFFFEGPNDFEEITGLLIKHGSSVDGSEHEHPLTTAIEKGFLSITQILLDHKADVDIDCFMNHLSLRTPNRLEIAKLLITYGYNVRRKKKVSGITALHLAAEFGDVDIAELLIEHGAKINAKSCQGVTPLHFAARWGHISTMKLLVLRGADICVPINVLDNTGLELMRYHGGNYWDAEFQGCDFSKLPPIITSPLQLARFYDIYDDPDFDDDFEYQETSRLTEEAMLSLWTRYHSWRMKKELLIVWGLLQKHPHCDHYSAQLNVFFDINLVGIIASFLGPTDSPVTM